MKKSGRMSAKVAASSSTISHHLQRVRNQPSVAAAKVASPTGGVMSPMIP